MTGQATFLILLCFFELGGAAVAEGAVQPGAVVPGDVLDDGPAGGGPGGPGLRVEQLAFERGEERFGNGVVPALAGAAGDSVTAQSLARAANSAEVYWQPRSEWKITPGRRVAGGDGVGQGVGDQLGAQVIGDRVADDAAGGDVDHGGQVQPALPGPDVGDVAAPAGVELGGVGGEVAADQVRPGGGGRVGDGGLPPPLRRPAARSRRRASAGPPACGQWRRPRRRSSACTRGAP